MSTLARYRGHPPDPRADRHFGRRAGRLPETLVVGGSAGLAEAGFGVLNVSAATVGQSERRPS